MKRLSILLGVALLTVGCTANPGDTSSSASSASVSTLDPQDCFIAGEQFDDDGAVSLQCGEGANAQVLFENGEATSTNGQLQGWKPLKVEKGTAEDPNFIRVQIQKDERICVYGRKLTDEPKKTWKNCHSVPKSSGGKLVEPQKNIDS